MNKEQLLARATELEIQVPEGASNAEIEALIKVAEHPIISAELATANSTIELLRDELNAKDPVKDDDGVIYESGNKTYKFGVNTFRFKGDKYEASEAVKDESLMTDLIKSGFNLLKEI